jgi:hypothetical protein
LGDGGIYQESERVSGREGKNKRGAETPKICGETLSEGTLQRGKGEREKS